MRHIIWGGKAHKQQTAAYILFIAAQHGATLIKLVTYIYNYEVSRLKFYSDLRSTFRDGTFLLPVRQSATSWNQIEIQLFCYELTYSTVCIYFRQRCVGVSDLKFRFQNFRESIFLPVRCCSLRTILYCSSSLPMLYNCTVCRCCTAAAVGCCILPLLL